MQSLASAALRRPRPSARPPTRARRQPRSIPCRSSSAGGAPPAAAPAPAPAAASSEAITLTDAALAHLLKLRRERTAAAPDGEAQQLVFRVGVKQGGCSGMSYTMDFESNDRLGADDYVMEYEGGAFKLACDPKSLLYLFGMRLDYSDALIGGGFNMQNPNATDSCGCGKSFGV